MKLILSRLAAIDLFEIFRDTIATFGQVQAEKYYRLILETFDLLIENPAAGHQRRDLSSTYLAFPVGQHIIVYRFDFNLKEVIIMRVFHSRMDFTMRM